MNTYMYTLFSARTVAKEHLPIIKSIEFLKVWLKKDRSKHPVNTRCEWRGEVGRNATQCDAKQGICQVALQCIQC